MIPILAIVFLILILLVGGDRGVISLIALCGNIGVLLLAVLAMTSGISPLLVTLAAGIFVNCITLLYQNGKNVKTSAALISVGIVVILLIAGVLILTNCMHIGGLNEIELRSDFSAYYSFHIAVDMNQVCISMIILGLLGAVMDTAVAIASAVYEVYENNRLLTEEELFESGIGIGKDVLATTLNTLYFAYIGEALMLLLYLQKYNYSVVGLLNSESFLQEFTSILFSAIGCVLIIPLCAAVSARMYKHEQSVMTDSVKK